VQAVLIYRGKMFYSIYLNLEYEYVWQNPGANPIKLYTAVTYEFSINYSVYPWQAFPAKSNVCG